MNGYGKMVLGYFGKTPVKPDEEVIKLAAKQLNLEPTTELAIDLADKDEKKSLEFTKKLLEKEGLETSDENIFIAAACKEKGIAFLKGEAKVNVRKNSSMPISTPLNLSKENKFTVSVNGNKYHVEVEPGYDKSVNVKNVSKINENEKPSDENAEAIKASISGNVFKIKVKEGDEVKAGDVVFVLEAMKMEIEVNAPKDGIIKTLCVQTGVSVSEGENLAIYKETK